MAGEDRVSFTVTLDGGPEVASQLQTIADRLAGTGAAARQAGEAGAAGMATLTEGLTAMLTQVTAAFLSFEALKKAGEELKEAIHFSDQVRDTEASLTALERTVGAGEEALAKFRGMAEQTRNTTLELASAYRDALPAAIRRGISDETLASLTVQASKIAPLLGQSLDETMRQLDQIMIGKGKLMRSPLLNLLLQGTGYTAEDITKGLVPFQAVWDSILPNIDKLAAKGEALGQTWDSAAKHIKDSLLEAFASGFNSANEGTQNAYNTMMKAFTAPEIREALKEIGRLIADWLPPLANAVAHMLKIAELATKGPAPMLAAEQRYVARETGLEGVDPQLFGQAKPGSPVWEAMQRFDAERMMNYRRAQTSGAAQVPFIGAMGPEMFAPGITSTEQTKLYEQALKAAVDTQTNFNASVANTHDHTTNAGRAFSDAAVEITKYTEAVKLANAKVQEEIDKVQARLAQPMTSKVLDPLTAQLQQIDASTADKKLAAQAEALNLNAKAAEMLASANDKYSGSGAAAGKITKDAYDALVLQAHGMQEVALRIYNDLIPGYDKLSDREKDQARVNFWDKQVESIHNLSMEFEKVTVSIDKMFADFARQNLGANALNPVFQVAQQTESESEASFADLLNKWNDARLKGDAATALVYEKAAKDLKTQMDEGAKLMLDAAKEWEKGVVGPFSDLFSSVILKGAAGFGQEAAKWFEQGIKDISHNLAEIFAKYIVGPAFGVSPPDQMQGPLQPGQTFDVQNAQASQLAAQQQSNIVGGVLTGIGSIYQGATAQQSDTQAAISGAAAGYAVATALASTGYGIVAGIVVAAGTYLAHLFQPSPGSSYQYATGIGVSEGGVLGGAPNKNIDTNTWKQWLAEGQKQFETFYDGYYHILMKLPLEILPEINKAFAPVYGYFESGADLGLAASQEFATELDRYFKEGLPHQIADRFSTYMEEGFTKLGFSADRFKEIWGELSNLDPATAMQLLSDLADAAISFNKALTYLATPVTGTGLDFWGSLMGQTAMTSNQSFIQSTADARKNILDLGNELHLLVGADQISSAKQLGTLLDDYVNKQKQYLQELAKVQDTINKSFQSSMDTYTLAGMKTASGAPDYQAQAKYLFNEVNLLYQQIGTATTPQQVQDLYNQISQKIQQIYQIGQNLGPDAAEKYRQWAMASLTQTHDAVLAQLEKLGKEAEDSNKAFLESLKTIVGDFETVLAKVFPPVTTNPGGPTGGPPDQQPGPDSTTTYQNSSLKIGGDMVATLQDSKGLLTDSRQLLTDIRDLLTKATTTDPNTNPNVRAGLFGANEWNPASTPNGHGLSAEMVDTLRALADAIAGGHLVKVEFDPLRIEVDNNGSSSDGGGFRSRTVTSR